MYFYVPPKRKTKTDFSLLSTTDIVIMERLILKGIETDRPDAKMGELKKLPACYLFPNWVGMHLGIYENWILLLE